MIPRFVDVHCHVQFDAYEEDRDAVIAEMKERSVSGILVGCDMKSSENAIRWAERHPHLFASIGLHPNHETDETFDIDTYKNLAQSQRVVAVGECGLDYYRPTDVTEELKKRQQELFKKHIALAAAVDKPLIIHARPSKGTQDAYQDTITLLTEAKHAHPNLRGDIHFFVGTEKEAAALIQLGFTVSFTAVITFARDYDAVIRAVPLDSILSETDAPYVAPVERRGKRNDPLAVQSVVEKLAEIRGEDPELVRAAMVANATRLFSLRPAYIGEMRAF